MVVYSLTTRQPVLEIGRPYEDSQMYTYQSLSQGGGDLISVGGYAFDHLYSLNAGSGDVELLASPGMEMQDALDHWPSDQANAQTADLD